MKLKNWIRRDSINADVANFLMENSFTLTETRKSIRTKSLSPESAVYSQNYQNYVVKGYMSDFTDPYNLTLRCEPGSTGLVEIEDGPITATFSTNVFEFKFRMRHILDPGPGGFEIFELEVEGDENTILFIGDYYRV